MFPEITIYHVLYNKISGGTPPDILFLLELPQEL